jgi:hypothetical protein
VKDCHPGEAREASDAVSKTLKPYETSIVSAESALQLASYQTMKQQNDAIHRRGSLHSCNKITLFI